MLCDTSITSAQVIEGGTRQSPEVCQSGEGEQVVLCMTLSPPNLIDCLTSAADDDEVGFMLSVPQFLNVWMGFKLCPAVEFEEEYTACHSARHKCS